MDLKLSQRKGRQAIQGFPFQPVTFAVQSLATKQSLPVKFAPLGLKWTLHAQIISACKRQDTSCFI